MRESSPAAVVVDLQQPAAAVVVPGADGALAGHPRADDGRRAGLSNGPIRSCRAEGGGSDTSALGRDTKTKITNYRYAASGGPKLVEVG